MIYIEIDGERQLVASLDGYEGAKVIETDVAAAPSHQAKREAGTWVEDADAKAKAKLEAKLLNMSRLEFLEYILAEVKKLPKE